jgi:CBS domain-containing protein
MSRDAWSRYGAGGSPHYDVQVLRLALARRLARERQQALDQFAAPLAFALDRLQLLRHLVASWHITADDRFLLALPLFAVLGAVVAWAGLALRAGIETSEKVFRSLKLPLEAKTTLGGIIVGLLAWWIPEVWGNGYDAVREVLSGALGPVVVLSLLAAKTVATSSTIGSGGSGGVFTPVLLLGACGGSLFGVLAQEMLPGLHVSPVFFALGGMSAALAATTFAPITALIIVFEMCQNYGAVMPLAIVTVTATWVARSLRRDSIYAEALRRRGVDFDLAFEQMALAALRAEDLIRTGPVTVRADAPLGAVLDLFGTSRATAIYVLKDGERLVGAIDLRDAFQVAGEAALRDSLVALDLVRDVPRVNPRTPLDEVMRRFSPLELAQQRLLAHDAQHALGVDHPAPAVQFVRHPPVAIARALQHDGLDRLAQRQRLQFRRRGPLAGIPPAPTEVQRRTQPAHRQGRIGLDQLGHQGVPLREAMLASPFFRASFSSASWPQKRSSSAMRPSLNGLAPRFSINHAVLRAGRPTTLVPGSKL